MKTATTFILAVFLLLVSWVLNAQSGAYTDDQLRDNPYWFEMMLKENPNYVEVKRAYDLYFEKHEKTRGSMYKIFERWAWKHRGDFEPDGTLIPDKIARAYERYKRENKDRGPATNAGDWMEIGPMVYPVNISGQETGTGRVNAIAFHPTDANTFWIGAPSGGLWKTTDGGTTYSSATDQLPTLGVSSIVVDPIDPDIIYMGTGDRDANDAPGLGVFKTTNGGVDWVPSNAGMENRTVGKMIMHPVTHSTLIAATSSGIYKTTDGGANWTLKSFNQNNYRDILFHPSNPAYVYATEGGKFYRSTNTGESWTQITSGLAGCNRMVLGVSAEEPDHVFCLLTGGSAIFHGLFRSVDSGLTFSRITPANHPNILGYNDGDDKSQAGYDLCMLVNPDDADQMLVGSINIHESTDGGVSFTKKTHWSNQLHADQHVVEINPLNNRILEGHDGGLHYSDDFFDTYTNISGGLRIAQTYRIGQAAQKRNLVFNGYQDNGSSIFKDGVFTTVAGGDGMESAFDYSDAAYAYTTYISQIKRSHTGGFGNYSTIASNGINGIDESGPWVTPYALHVTDPNTLFFGYKNIWRTNNVKSNPPTWTKISNNLAGSNTLNILFTDQSMADPNVFYAAREDNKLFRSDDVNGATPGWTDLSASLPQGNANIDDVMCHPSDPEVVYLIQSEHVYKSGDKGNTWSDITGSLPVGTNLNCMVYDKYSDEGIYVGTKTGVFYKNASLSDWIAFDGGLPVVDVRELEIYYGNTESRLRAGTYGRGLWETGLYSSPGLPPVAHFQANTTSTFVGEIVSLEDLSSHAPDSWTWSISPASFTYQNGTNANSQHPDVSFTSPGVYSVSLTASNTSGSDTKTILSYIHVFTEVAPDCTPATHNLGNYLMGILHVALNTIDRYSGQAHEDNPNPPAGYMNFITSDNTVLQPNTTYPLTVELGTGYTEYWNVYIDYNNDGDFYDANETVYTAPTKVSGVQNINITTIANPPLNQLLRMRILCDYYSISGPCDNPDYGQAEDYGIVFKDSPILTTEAVSAINYHTAQSGGNITDQGSSAVAARGIVWDIRPDPTLDRNWGFTENGSGTGSFTSSLTGLAPNTTYYVRAYSVNDESTGYGNTLSFITLPQYPEVSTAVISGLTAISAVSGGNVTTDSGSPVTERGIVWSTDQNPVLSNCLGKSYSGSGTGTFVCNLYGLTPATTYYVRAFARNAFSIAYGDEKTCTTLSPDANQSRDIVFYDLRTDEVSLSWTNGTGESRIVKMHDVNSFTLPVDGTDPAANPVYGGGEQVVYNGTGNAVTVTNLDPSTEYYFFVFDYNGQGSGTVFNTNAGINNPASIYTYCLPDYTYGDAGTHIKKFILNTINHASGASHYSDYTYINTPLLVGGMYDVSVEMSYNAEKVSLWIDWNDNGLFEDGEKLISDLSCPAGTTTTTQITLPAGAPLGNHVLRVRASFWSGLDACGTGGWGEAEDYTVNFKDVISWTGTTSTDWFTASNWDVGKVPVATNHVVIKAAPFKPIIEVGLTGLAKKVTSISGAELEVRGTLHIEE